ncbi:serine/threonine kinase 16 [Cryomyces antarcticus]|uniref:Major facilitator superfamily (MFS) profile domain-containing protein n=1 Tax=Cryomyces antarcticus TaxID=329879 RepID=A0ABR0KUT7_9PEZI|nr:hypothetical protein LTR39_000418 [Cryomyces antarcticus]KAK5131983.1 hypothetical protein LTR16_000204 [Cryomyces antarcticus]
MEMNYTDRELHQIEKELHTQILPGTEVMADVGTHHFVKGGSHVLVPQPSNDPHDSLNWSFKWKMFAIIASTTVSFTQGFGPLALAPMFGYYIEEFHCSLADAIQFTGVCILVLGFSNFIWVPISTSFGRRPVYIASQLICFGSMIWRARAKTYSSFMGACVVNGIGAGPAETIQPAVMFPETKWHRLHPDELVQTSPTLSQEKMQMAIGVEDSEKNIGRTDTHTTMPGLTASETAARDPYLGKGGPSKLQWRPFQPNAHPFKSILMDLWIPWKLFAFPIVEFASFVVSWSCSSFLTLNLTQTQAFAAPPYNLSSQSIGFFNFAILIGAFIGLGTAGPLSDWVSARATRKNHGIREPEMRLPAMIPYVLVMILGNVVAAVGYQYKWNYWAIVIIGYTCAGLQVAGLPAIASTYAVDSYKPVAGSLFVSITVNKNVWGYGFSRFITEWIVKDGFIPPIMTNMALVTLWCSFGILFYYKGKTFRKWSKDSKVHRM